MSERKYYEGKELLDRVDQVEDFHLSHSAARLVASEGNWVQGYAYETPQALLDAFLDPEDPSAYGMDCLPKDATPARKVDFILTTNWSWGEFLGAVLASWAGWDADTREKLQFALRDATKWAAADGVDH